MKKNVLLFVLILLTFIVKINVTNAASYVDTEHGVTCKYNLASNSYSLTLLHDGSISQSATGSADAALSDVTVNVTLYDKKVVADYNFSTDNNIEEFANVKVESTKGTKVSIGYKSSFTAFKASKGDALQRYNYLRGCPNMYFVYYKSGNTYYIINMLPWHYAGVGTAEGTQEIEIDKVFDTIKSNPCPAASDSYKEQVCIYKDGSNATLWVDLVYNKVNGTYKWVLNDGFFGNGLTQAKDYNGNVPYANSMGSYKCQAYTNNVKSGEGRNCPSTLYYYFDNSFGKYYVVKNKPSQSGTKTLTLKKNYKFVVPSDSYKLLLVSHGGIRSNDTSTNRVPTDGTTEQQVVDFCKTHPDDKGCKSFCQNHKDLAACKKLSFTTYTFKFCEDKGILKSLKIVHTLIVIAKILVPLILIIVGGVEFGKASLAGDANTLEKVTQSFIIKLIVGLAIFMIPTIVDSLVHLAQSNKDVNDVKTGAFSKCTACFTGMKTCDTYISNGKD